MPCSNPAFVQCAILRPCPLDDVRSPLLLGWVFTQRAAAPELPFVCSTMPSAGMFRTQASARAQLRGQSRSSNVMARAGVKFQKYQGLGNNFILVRACSTAQMLQSCSNSVISRRDARGLRPFSVCVRHLYQLVGALLVCTRHVNCTSATSSVHRRYSNSTQAHAHRGNCPCRWTTEANKN